MKVYHVETKKDCKALMIELEEKGHRWLSGNSPTFFNYLERSKEDSCVIISSKYITFMNIERCEKKYPYTPIIEYKAKGENMKQKEMKQKEMKQNILDWARDVSVAVESFARGMYEAEADLQEAKSSTKKLIEKIDEYLESQKPKFKVGDYVTVYVNSKRKTAKIEKIDELVENNSKVHGLWYDRTLVNIKQDYWYSSGLNEFRHATPEEIAEYEAALTFHKHGRKPFELKKGDSIRKPSGNLTFILNPENYTKEDFLKYGWEFLKTVEEVNEWLENK